MDATVDKGLFWHLLESAPDAIVITNERAVVVLSNSQAEKLFGYAKEELKGRPIEDLMPERYRHNHVRHRNSYLEAPSVRPMGAGLELFARRSDGAEFPAEISISPLKIEGEMYVTSVIRDISERKRVEEKIRASLREKEVLLKEVHHRVKNNLQVISSIINLQAQTLEDEDTRQIFNDTRARIRSIALVHERLYESKNLEDIDFRSYVEGLVEDIREVYAVRPEIQITISMCDHSLVIDRVVNMGLIINELMSNAIKYAFPNGAAGEITIFLEDTGSGLILGVRDNGVGLPEGFSLQGIKTLGLVLVQGLTGEMNGTLTMNHHAGTEFRIAIPR